MCLGVWKISESDLTRGKQLKKFALLGLEDYGLMKLIQLNKHFLAEENVLLIKKVQ